MMFGNYGIFSLIFKLFLYNKNDLYFKYTYNATQIFLYFTPTSCDCQSPRRIMRALFRGEKCVKIKRYEYNYDF